MQRPSRRGSRWWEVAHRMYSEEKQELFRLLRQHWPLVLTGPTAWAQRYPDKPVTVTSPIPRRRQRRSAACLRIAHQAHGTTVPCAERDGANGSTGAASSAVKRRLSSRSLGRALIQNPYLQGQTASTTRALLPSPSSPRSISFWSSAASGKSGAGQIFEGSCGYAELRFPGVGNTAHHRRC